MTAIGADILGVLLTAALLLANAFFVGAEFALISARRDRLDALAESGKKRAVTVIEAGQNLSLMLAGAQLGITICSILLGRIGEPAIAHLLERPFELLGVPVAVMHTVAFVLSLSIVVLLHVLLGEMVPKNIAIAGPESAAMLLIPPYLVYIRLARPLIGFYNWCANTVLRLARVPVKDELEVTVSTVELSEMIAESLSEGLLDEEEHTRLRRALQIQHRVVADVVVPADRIRAVAVSGSASGPTVGAVERAVIETGYSRFPVVGPGGDYLGYLHMKDILTLGDDPAMVVDRSVIRPLPRVHGSVPLPEALSRLRRSNSHLALMSATDGTIVGLVTLEDLVEDLVGTVRDGTHRDERGVERGSGSDSYQ
jgi:CBS domain containing-hemolysin-like protein